MIWSALALVHSIVKHNSKASGKLHVLFAILDYVGQELFKFNTQNQFWTPCITNGTSPLAYAYI